MCRYQQLSRSHGLLLTLRDKPVDVIKTLVQNTEGGDTASAWEVATQLYQDEGIGAFFKEQDSNEEREEILMRCIELGAKWVDVEAEFPLGNLPVDKCLRSVHLKEN